jgi:hypothetical protein
LQLKKKKRAGQIRENLAMFSASLLAATIAPAANEAKAQYNDSGYNNDIFGPGIAYSEVDSALLVYQEPGGRVQAIEPATDLTAHGAGGQQLTLGLAFDAVSGATPNGAVPANQTQTFVTPLRAQGSTVTVTSASGGSTVIHLPPSSGDIASAALGRQYTVAPNALPMDRGFRDHRIGFNFGLSFPLGGISNVGFGGGYSIERDYRAITANARIAQNFNGDDTTISLSLNTELDSSFPYGGVPTPLTPMIPDWKTPSSRGKTQLGLVLGLTEVMTRRWLMQLDYSVDMQSGYQNDPYRIISVVDPVSGEPTSYLYENRPGNRRSQSLFWDNKLDYGPAVTDLSLRYFTDNWGVTSKTAELSERIRLARWAYVEPSARWYQQSAANFFDNYLVGGQALPAFASSDPRLGKFTAITYGAKVGFNLTGRTEFYVRGGYYQQTGDGHPADAIGQLKQQNLFAGTNAAFVFLGYNWDFH